MLEGPGRQHHGRGRHRRHHHGRRPVRAAVRQDQGGDQGDRAVAGQIPGQHALPRRSHRRQRELRQGRRHHRRARQHPRAPRGRHDQWPDRRARRRRGRPRRCRSRPISAARSRSRPAAARRSSPTSPTPTPTATPGSISPTPTCSATGDTFNNLKRYQNIDFANGGDVRGMIRALDTYLKAVERQHQDRAGPRPARHQGGSCRRSATCW